MFKAVIFDMDGLMVDTERLLQRFWVEAAEELGFPMRPEHVLDIRSMSAPYAEGHLKRIVCPDFDYPRVRARRQQLMNAYIKEQGIDKKPGLDRLLDRIGRSDLKAAVCTATDYPRTEWYLKSIGVFEKFDEFICGNMVANGKPAPDIYIRACAQLGLDPRECVALEDSPNGVISAAVAHLNVIMIPDLTQPTRDILPLTYAVCETLDKAGEVIFRG
ncbi:MAG: HAD family phosphatase [Ruminococcus sp.]|nr:HAD family phosphatase [Ruminococcus sp.]